MFTVPESTHPQLSKNVCHAYGSYHESKCHIFRGVKYLILAKMRTSIFAVFLLAVLALLTSGSIRPGIKLASLVNKMAYMHRKSRYFTSRPVQNG